MTQKTKFNKNEIFRLKNIYITKNENPHKKKMENLLKEKKKTTH